MHAPARCAAPFAGSGVAQRPWQTLTPPRVRAAQVQENCIDLVGRIADRGAEYVPAREWMRICFELLEMLKAHKKGIRRATVNTFGYIAKAIGPQARAPRRPRRPAAPDSAWLQGCPLRLPHSVFASVRGGRQPGAEPLKASQCQTVTDEAVCHRLHRAQHPVSVAVCQ